MVYTRTEYNRPSVFCFVLFSSRYASAGSSLQAFFSHQRKLEDAQGHAR